MAVKPFNILFMALIIASGYVAGAPSWPSWATQTIPACPKGTKYILRQTWSGATYGICAQKVAKKSFKKTTAGSAPRPTSIGDELSRMIKKSTNLKMFDMTTRRRIVTASTTTTPPTTAKTTKKAETTTATTTKATSVTAKRTTTTAASLSTTPAESTSSPSSTSTSSTISIGAAIIVTVDDMSFKTTAKLEEDDLDRRNSIDDVKDNSLEQGISLKEKIYKGTSVNQNLHNNNNISNPQGLDWIDFDYNNDPEREERIEFDLTLGGNFYAYDYDHVIFPRSPKAIIVVP